VDKVIVDLGLTTVPAAGSGAHIRPDGLILGAYAKNGNALISLSGTTPVTISLADLTSNTTVSAGDTVFATGNVIVFRNLTAGAVTIAPGASNPSNFPLFAGTTPTLTVPANSVVVVHSAAGVTIDSTHKTILITPAVTGTFSVSVGGA
jgi:hypothetical protein